jgi:hypothetical protein
MNLIIVIVVIAMFSVFAFMHAESKLISST